MNSVKKQLHFLPAPFIGTPITFEGILRDRFIATIPLALGSIYFWGMSAVTSLIVAVLTALIVEEISWKLMGKKSRIYDLNAATIGIVFVLFIPAGVPWWVVMLGVALSIIFGKMVFGGIAYAPFAPALIGYAMINASWPNYLIPSEMVTETNLLDPLLEIKSLGIDSLIVTYSDIFVGEQLSVMGATSLGLVLVSLVFLLLRKAIRYEVVIGYILGILFFSYLGLSVDPVLNAPPLLFLSTGTVLLSLMFFMSDFGTIPARTIPRYLYGLIVAGLIVLFRVYTSNFDAAPLGVLFAGFLVPFLDMIKSRPFGKRRS
ncbi:MAG: RnfABCDGE type electron transport complex subunit D [Desulfovibrionaceae bacterium]